MAMTDLRRLPVGGTAVGTGINGHPEFAGRVCELLSTWTQTKPPFKESRNHFADQATLDAAVAAHAPLKTLAVSLIKIANADPSRLIEVPTRGTVGPGNDIMIAGFIIDGSSSKTVLVRAVGPTLGAFGVSNALADAIRDTSGVPEMLLVIGVYCVLNFIIQSLIQPRFIGDSVGLAMTTTFVALVFWNWLFLDNTMYAPEASQNEEWNRGAYLARSVGQCSACHSPRNRFGAIRKDAYLAGGEAEGWYAPPLNEQSPSPVPWTVDELTAYLRTGIAGKHAIAGGPMQQVVYNLAQADERDVRAIAV